MDSEDLGLPLQRRPAATSPILWVTREQLRSLRHHLLRPDGREYMAYAFCHSVAIDDLRIIEVFPALSADYRSHGPGHIRLTGGFQVRAKTRCRELQPVAVIQIHSHPFAEEGWFSLVDDGDFPEIAYDFVNAWPSVRCGRWVWGRRIRHSRLEAGGPGERELATLRRASFRVASAGGGSEPVAAQT